MSKPILLQDDFSGGSYQDKPRHQLPKGKAWMVTDMIPNMQGVNAPSTRGLKRRMGWGRVFPLNHVANPWFETDTTGWAVTAETGIATLTREAATGGFSNWAGQNAVTGSSATKVCTLYMTDAASVPLTPGATAAAVMRAKIVSGVASSMVVNYSYLTSGFAVISSAAVMAAQSNPVNGTWYQFTGTIPAAPATTAYVKLTLSVVIGSGTAITFQGMEASLAPSTSYATGVGFAPFPSAGKILGFDQVGKLYEASLGYGPGNSYVGQAVVPAHAPVFYRDKAIIFDVNGSTAPKKYDGTTLAALGGSPPAASVATIFKDHLVCANSAANRNRVWFASAGNPESWDTAAAGQWLDASRNVLGLATVRNMILVFEEGQTERIRGDIIPGVVGSDIVVEPLLSVGCADPASIATTVDYCIFANNQGIYLCDGIGAVNLTEQCGMASYWRYKIPNYEAGWNIAAALFNNWYFFSVLSSGTFVIAGAIHVPTRTWVSLTNVSASMMVATPQGSYNIAGDYLWMSEILTPNISSLGAILSDLSGSSTVDGDGTALTWSLETPYYKGNPGLKRWKNVYLTYDAIGGAPAIVVARVPDPTSVTYTQVGSTITSSGYNRKRVLGGKAIDGLGLKISGDAIATSIYAIEADGWPLEPGRL